MEAVYYANDKTYVVSSCAKEEIQDHYDLVSYRVDELDKERYINDMVESISQGYAWKTVVDGAVVAIIYVRMERNQWFGCALRGMDMIGMLLAWKTLYEAIGNKYIKFNPHEGELKELKSIVTSISLRQWHMDKNHITVNTASLSSKLKHVYEKLGIYQ